MKRAGGRPPHKYYEEGKFERFGKQSVRCLVCNQIWQNTAQKRLQEHRKNCFVPEAEDVIEVENISQSAMNVDKSSSNQTSKELNITTDLNVNSFSKTLPNFVTPENKSISTRKRKLNNFIDAISEPEQERADLALAKFMFAHNLSFEVLNSSYFKEFITKLRPAYRVPSVDDVATSLLHKIHSELVENQQKIKFSDCIVMILKSKDSSPTAMSLTAVMKTSNGDNVYIKTSEAEEAQGYFTHEALIVEEAVDMIHEKYGAQVYAVVLQDALMERNVEKNEETWYLVDQKYFIEGCGKQINCTFVTKQLIKLFEKLQISESQQAIFDRGGTQLIIAHSDSWRSVRDMYSSYLDNLLIIKHVMVDSSIKLGDEILKLFDHSFQDTVKDRLELLIFFTEVSSACDDKDTNLGDIAEKWLQLEALCQKKGINIDGFDEMLKAEMLAANFFHPKYRGCLFANDTSRMKQLSLYLLKMLSEKALDSYRAYKEQHEPFDKLFNKICYWKLFWTLNESHHPDLSKYVIRLLSIPVSIENFTLHPIPENDLTPNRQNKLMEVHNYLTVSTSKTSHTK